MYNNTKCITVLVHVSSINIEIHFFEYFNVQIIFIVSLIAIFCILLLSVSNYNLFY